MNLAKLIHSQRLKMGLTQQHLASRGGISLSTLQKIEAGRVSPSMDTVEALLPVLGLKLECTPEPISWDMLSALGVPISAKHLQKIEPDSELLIHHLLKFWSHSGRDQISQTREGRAIIATLLAIHIHYPTLYKKRLAKVIGREWFQKMARKGDIIKLYRLALAQLQGKQVPGVFFGCITSKKYAWHLLSIYLPVKLAATNSPEGFRKM